MHRLSGGFDSSLVAYCLSTAPFAPEVTCINYFWEGRHIDEREFARVVAKEKGLRLIEQRLGTSERLDSVRKVERTVAPVLDVLDWQEHACERQLAQSLGASAIFTGNLGDSLFDRMPYLSPASDYLRARGFDAGFPRIVMDVALHQRVSIWKVLSHVISEILVGATKGPWSPQIAMLEMGAFDERNILVSDDAIETLRRQSLDYTHSWLQYVAGVPAGKLWTIMTLFAEGFHDAHFKQPEDPPIVAPYISQPLVETCLRIPTYLNVSGGMERAVARAAFARELPQAVLRRPSKGSPNTWLKAMIERDARFVREYLLTGLLVTQGVLDREKLEQALPGQITHAASHGGSVMNLLYTEAWLQAWSSKARLEVA